MKKRFLFLLIAVFLTACTGKENEPIREENPTEQEQTQKETEEEQKEAVVPLQVLLEEQHLEEWTERPEGEFMVYDTQLCSVSWQNLILCEESAEAYPELAARLRERKTEDEVSYHEMMADLLPLAEEDLSYWEEGFIPYSVSGNFCVQRADNIIFSVRKNFEEYSGGAHSMYGTIGMNYDTVSGAELKLTDILTEVDALPEILAEKVKEKYADEFETFETLQEMLAVEYAPEDYNWTLGYQGITFYFNPYEIASFSKGVITVSIWFNEMPGLFKEEYTYRPEAGFVMTPALGFETEVDLNPEDESRDTLFVAAYPMDDLDVENGILRLHVGVNDKWYEDTEYYGYQFTPYLVCVGEKESEKWILYVESVAENDYQRIQIFDLSGGEPLPVEVLDATGFSGYWDETEGEYGTYYEQVCNDPRSFELTTRTEILGTFGGTRMYSIEADGSLKADTEYYDLSQVEAPIVSIIPLEVVMLPEEKAEELPAGTNFYFLRTDGESYVDMRLDDGRECRIEVEVQGWQQFIQGVDQWECFENLMYAG